MVQTTFETRVASLDYGFCQPCQFWGQMHALTAIYQQVFCRQCQLWCKMLWYPAGTWRQDDVVLNWYDVIASTSRRHRFGTKRPLAIRHNIAVQFDSHSSQPYWNMNILVPVNQYVIKMFSLNSETDISMKMWWYDVFANTLLWSPLR